MDVENLSQKFSQFWSYQVLTGSKILPGKYPGYWWVGIFSSPKSDDKKKKLYNLILYIHTYENIKTSPRVL